MLVCDLITCWLSYYGGREAFMPLLMPPGLLPALATLALLLLYLGLALRRPIVWTSLLGRLCIAALVPLLFKMPGFFGDSYYDMGRREHVRRIANQQVVDEVRRLVARKLVAEDGALGSINPNELPVALSAGGWRSPGTGWHNRDAATGRTEIHLTWGSALVFHHGLVIIDPPDQGSCPAGEYSKVETWLPGAWIVNYKD